MAFPNIIGTTMNGGTAPSPSVTLSKIKSVEITFDVPITATVGAFSASTSAPVPYSLTDATGGGIIVSTAGAVATLTFDPAVMGVEYGSLGDGIWTFTVDKSKLNVTEEITDVRRLFGDLNGDGTVDLTDFGTFGPTFGTSTGGPAFLDDADFDSDGTIDLTDFGAFGSRFGTSL